MIENLNIWIAVIGLLGTALGAAIGIIGSLIHDGGESNRHAAQLEHDAQQRDRDRAMSAKVDVYMKAAEAVLKSQWLMSSLGNIDIPDAELMLKYQDDIAALVRIQVVGSNETVRAISVFQGAFASYYYEITLKRVALRILQEKIKKLNELAEISDKKCSEAMARAAIVNSSLPASKPWSDYALESLNASRKAAELSDKEFAERIQLFRLCSERVISLGSLLVPAVFAVRHELELPFDEEEFNRIAENTVTESMRLMDAFATQLEEIVAEAKKETP